MAVVKPLLGAGVSLANVRLAMRTLREHGMAELAGLTLVSDGAGRVFLCGAMMR